MRDESEYKGRYYVFSVLFYICMEISQLLLVLTTTLQGKKGAHVWVLNSIPLINVSILMSVPCWFYYYGFIVQLEI